MNPAHDPAVRKQRRAGRDQPVHAVADEGQDDGHVEAVDEDRQDPAVPEEQGLDDERDADSDDRGPRPEDRRDERRRPRHARSSRPGTGTLNIMIVKVSAEKIARSGIVRLFRTVLTRCVATPMTGSVTNPAPTEMMGLRYPSGMCKRDALRGAGDW